MSPSTSAGPAAPLAGFVVDRVRGVGRDPALLLEVLARVRCHQEARAVELGAEKALSADLAGRKRQLALEPARFRPGEDNADVVRRLADRLRGCGSSGGQQPPTPCRRSRRGRFWRGSTRCVVALSPGERARVAGLLVRAVVLDGATRRARRRLR